MSLLMFLIMSQKGTTKIWVHLLIALITTHFSYLTKLETSGKYKNYKIPIKRNELNEIVYPYKLQEGASDQHIALELQKKNKQKLE